MACSALPTPSGLALVLLALPATSQLTVGPPGSGAAFDQIDDALAVAAVGETVLVAPGTYEPFTVTQGVSVVGAGSGQTEVAIPAGSTEGAIDVVGVPAGQTARVSGIMLSSATTSADGRIEIVQCAGRVELVDVVSQHPAFGVGYFVDEPTARVEDCTAVVIDGCDLRGSRPPTQSDWMSASTALLVRNSSVWIQGSSLRGGWGVEGYGAEALRVEAGSFVHVSASELYGGSGGAHFGFYWWDIYGYSGEEGLRATDSEVVLAGGPGNVCEGAPGFQLSGTDWTGGGSAAQLAGSAVLRYASDVVLVAGDHGDGTPNTHLVVVAPTATAVAEPVVRPTLGFDLPGAQLGQTVQLTTTGNPGATHLVFLALGGIAPVALGNGRHVHLDPTTAVALPPIGLDGSGEASLPVVVPPSTALAGLELVLQGLDANVGALRLTNPALATILH